MLSGPPTPNSTDPNSGGGYDHGVADNISKENCKFPISQGWGHEDLEVMEQKQREQIQKLPYWRVVVQRQLDIIADRVSQAEVPALHKATDGLNGV